MKVLLVDDHTLFREGLNLLLKSLSSGVVVREAGSLERARQVLEEDGPFDMVLLDLQLPGVSRLGALHWIRKLDGDLPVVVLTGSEDPEIIHDAIESGAMGFIKKSVDSEEMMQALQQVLSGGVYLPPVCLGVRNDRPQVSASRFGISPRQAEVLQMLAQGKSNKLIARELGISDTTVKSHVKAVFDALDVHSRTQAVFVLARLGWQLHETGS
ncbi:MAG TPA: response regulator transcription factor [Burkholderiaceae bacterium]|nr:response regulator transcription factor [Burkholderiaceae bacterium]